MDNSNRLIKKKDLFKVFLRSFALQGSESYTHMQALGYAFCMVPILKMIYRGDKTRLSEALLRHTTFLIQLLMLHHLLWELQQQWKRKMQSKKTLIRIQFRQLKLL